MFFNGRLPGGGAWSWPGGPDVDLEGGFVLPGLWDAHIHFSLWSLGLARLQLAPCDSRFAVLEAVREWPSSWVLGQGWNESRWADPTLVTRSELDAAGGGRPVVLLRSDLHSAIASSSALALAGLTSDSGRVVELDVAALLAVVPAPSAWELESALRLGCAALHRLGVTGIVDQRLPTGEELPFGLYQRLGLPLRIVCNRSVGQAWDGEGSEWVRRGHLKLFSDGSMGSRTAQMLSGGGVWITSPADLRPHFEETERDRISIHAIGDRAVREVLDLFEECGVVPGDRIEHVQLLSDEDVPRLARLGLVASMQPVHVRDDEELAQQLPFEERRTYYRLADLHSWGTSLEFGSDAPVADPSPWLGLEAAVHGHFLPSQRLPADVALAAYTLGPPGDFVVIDRDPLACKDFREVHVVRTVVGGETVFEA